MVVKVPCKKNLLQSHDFMKAHQKIWNLQRDIDQNCCMRLFVCFSNNTNEELDSAKYMYGYLLSNTELSSLTWQTVVTF